MLSNGSPRLYLDDILEAIVLIKDYTASMDFDDFSHDRKNPGCRGAQPGKY